MGRSIAKLSLDAFGGADSSAAPTEFRLFVRGENPTEHGTFIFDDAAAAAVMAAYQAHGVDLAIDLEHQMLDAPTADPTARDARGWFKLELRPDGSLWAVDVKWTPDGAARLAEKRQRYVSPAFEIDPATMRVTKIINVAITAIPATHETPALVAATVRGSMNADAVKQALDALIAGDAEKCAEILKGMIAEAAGGEEPAEAPAPEAPPEEAAAAAVPPAEEDPAKKDEEEEKAAAVVASSLIRLSGRASLVEALADVALWRESHIKLEAETQRLAAERAQLEAADRRKLVAELVTLGAEFPSTVWADDAAKTLKARWQNMPIAELRAHVAEQREARKGGAAAPKPATRTTSAAGDQTFTTPHGVVTLSASELAECARAGAKPETYAAHKAARDAQRRRAGKKES